MSDFICVPDQDVVISSRVRLARNFDDMPFAARMTGEYADEVIERTSRVVFAGNNGSDYMLLRMKDLSDDARSRLVEHNYVSIDMMRYVSRGAVMLSSSGNACIMMNAEDHLRFQGMMAGQQLPSCVDKALAQEKEFEDKYNFAFDDQFGFLTANPINAGTALRATVTLHLPALAPHMDAVMQSVSKNGLRISSLARKGEPGAGFYQMANQGTLGRSEEEIIETMITKTEEIIEQERQAREEIEKEDRVRIQDKLFRSLGIAMEARLMNRQELMLRYSDIRYAACMGYVRLPVASLDHLIMNLMPGSLGVRAGHIMSEREAEIFRAETLRNELRRLNDSTGGD